MDDFCSIIASGITPRRKSKAVYSSEQGNQHRNYPRKFPENFRKKRSGAKIVGMITHP